MKLHGTLGLARDWFAVDRTGAVGRFASAGPGLIPPALLADDIDPEIVKAGVLELPAHGEAVLASVATADRGESMEFARRGLWSFDKSPHGGAYELFARPVRPIRIDALPESLRATLERVRLPEVVFGEVDVLPLEALGISAAAWPGDASSGKQERLTPSPRAERHRAARDRGLEVLVRTALPLGTSAEAYARTLRSLEDARSSVLSDVELRELRQSVLDEICARAPLWSPMLRLLTLLALVSGAVAIVGHLLNTESAYFGGGFLAVTLLITMGIMTLKRSRANRRSVEERLAIVEHLRSQRLLLPSEAEEARRTILAQRAADPPSS